MKKKLMVVLALALSCTLLFGCSNSGSSSNTSSGSASTPSSKSNVRIGFVPMTLNNEYFITMVNAAKQKASALGVQLDVQAADQHASAAAQLTIVENMITSGVNAICIVPSSSQGLATVLKKCKEANIPVINIDTIIDASVLKEAGVTVPFYGTDNYKGAKLAGEYVVKNMPKGTKTAILTGIAGQQNTADRRNGFVDATKGHIQVVAEQSANWEVDQGYTATQNILSGNPDTKLIFCGNDSMAIGALRAVQEAGKADSIKIIGFDGISDALNNVKSGKLLGSVAQDPANMGMMGVENAVKLVKGEKVDEKVDTGSKLITKDNVQEQIDYLAKFK